MEMDFNIGEVIPGGILLVSYGQYSLGWKIGVEYLKREVDKGAFGIILNTTVPVRKLFERARSAGFDIVDAGKNGRLAVIDLFNEETGLDFVYPIETIDRTLIIPRVEKVMDEIREEYHLNGREVVGTIATLDGLYELFGEKFLKNLILQYLVRSERLLRDGYNHRAIFIVNRDTIPKELHAWIVSVSDYVILTEGIMDRASLIENTVLLKSLAPGFTQRMFQTTVPAERLR
ncbi:hypothetical protein [Thermococcus barossii]|uniref:KaiC-like domain-containing protein n=1 Tax=Thermococcus barossii TaxID=54077 RepID=A0A2Z2MSF1_9EURY|nr:hypothetical protein [Thermococcus barossii]ASJ05231.1 hypothetical protein A3L01_07560 [Thermococcus barossii]